MSTPQDSESRDNGVVTGAVEERHACARCGKELVPGGLFYRVRLAVSAGDDGFLDGDAPENQLSRLGRLLQGIEASSAEELLGAVHRERELVMCRRCADEVWVAVTDGEHRSVH